MQQIAPNIYTFSGLTVGRAYLIKDEDGLTLIDASISRSAPKIIAQIQALGHSIQDLKRIFITHAHPDHVGGLKAVQAASGAEVYATNEEKQVIEGEKTIPSPERAVLHGIHKFLVPPPTRISASPVHHIINDGETYPVGGGLQVIATPGHAQGHVAFYLPAHKLIFGGDVLMALFNRLTFPLPSATVDMATNRQSLTKFLALDLQIIALGHGAPITENAQQRLHDWAKTKGVG